MTNQRLSEAVEDALRSAEIFIESASGLRLRSYQRAASSAIIDSVIQRRGLSFVVIFPRQSGKNELQAQIQAYLLTLMARTQCEIVQISPTWKPQAQNAMRRLERVLKRNSIASNLWKKEQGYIYVIDTARIYFLSGSPTTNIVGATASELLSIDEAQDILPDKYDKEIAPMAASANATRVFWGTSWTSQTLLAREKRAALEAQARDGFQRVFLVDADEVGREVRAYCKFVAAEIAKHGRNHPFVRTQYYSEEIDSQGGMFPPERLELMRGDHLPWASPDDYARDPRPQPIFAFLIDVAGSDEDSRAPGETGESLREHDATTLTIVHVDPRSIRDPLINAPTYRVKQRLLWENVSQTALYAQLSDLINRWQPQHVIIDATGLGAGLAAFLAKAQPGLVTPFVFTSKSKSDLAWTWISIIETGRYKEPRIDGECQTCDPRMRELTELFWEQAKHTAFEVIPGPNRLVRWGVPEGRRNSQSGKLLHDDLVMSAALIAVLEEHPWGSAESVIVNALDPLDDLRI